jgi:amino acid transporter
MIYCVAIGIGTGFVFLVCLLFVAGSIPDVIESRYGPLGQIILHATGSRPGTVCLLIFPLVCIMFATNSAMTTSSRMTYAFARDGGLPFSKFFARVHKKLDVPLEALGLTTLVVVIFGLILIGSSSAFSAIIAASVVALGISYAMPVAINCLRGRRMLPPTRAFIMPEWFAWIANIIGVCYVVLTTVLFLFPPELPVNGMNMNYCVVAFAIVFAISMITWIFDGRKNFTGPKFEINHHVLSAEEVPSEDFSPNQTRDDINEEKKPVTQTHS